MGSFLDEVKGGIIVSCQASPGDPTYCTEMMVAFAKSAKIGGAVGIRANSPEDVAAIKKETNLPMIGIWKRPSLDDMFPIIITPTVEDAQEIKAAGADVIAVDVTTRPRPGGLGPVELIQKIHAEVDIPIMADCSSLEDAIRAQEAGCEMAGTTLAFPSGLGLYEPNLKLLEEMINTLDIPIIAEGRYWEPQHIEQAFDLGMHSIVVGSAITRPWLVTERFVSATPRAK